MTSDGRVIVPTPNHRDRERALRGALARMRGENDVLPLMARECETATAIIYSSGDQCLLTAGGWDSERHGRERHRVWPCVSNALRKPIAMGGKANVQWPSTSGNLGRG